MFYPDWPNLAFVGFVRPNFGSPLSPMLSNIVLGVLVQELERRGLLYPRWADDFVILVGSRRAAERVMVSVIRYLEEEPGLPVNRDKSIIARIEEVTFLGFPVEGTKISIRPESQARFTKRVKSVTQRNNPKPLEQIVVELNLFVRGWGNYFRIQERRSAFVTLDHWVRQRLRPCPTRPYSSNGVNRMGDNMHIS